MYKVKTKKLNNNMTDTKRYRLLKDLPYVKAGAIYERNEYGNYLCDSAEFLVKDIYHDTLANTVVENNPEWLEEVLLVSEPVKERIEVIDFGLYKSNERWFEFGLTKVISEDKFPAIKQAIESCLNEPLPQPPSALNDTVVEDKPVTKKMSNIDAYQLGLKDGIKFQQQQNQQSCS